MNLNDLNGCFDNAAPTSEQKQRMLKVILERENEKGEIVAIRRWTKKLKVAAVAAILLTLMTVTVGAYVVYQNFVRDILDRPHWVSLEEMSIDELRESEDVFDAYEKTSVQGIPVIIITREASIDIPEDALPMHTVIENVIEHAKSAYNEDITAMNDIYFRVSIQGRGSPGGALLNPELNQLPDRWIIFIDGTNHEKFFYYEVDVRTGEILHSMQNTEETPFLG